MQKIVIIGAHSYTGDGLQEHLKDFQVHELTHRNWLEHLYLLKEADYVINFAIAPEFSERIVQPEEVLDWQIAKHLQDCNTRYVFISSRKVYGSHNECKHYREDAPLQGSDAYSHNKIMMERELLHILGRRLLVLRIANVIGEPVSRVNYKTFIGWICQSIQEKGRLTVAQNSHSVKDFITKDFLHRSIAHLLRSTCCGTYNISSGFGLSVRELLNGYVGESRVSYIGDDSTIQDQFILDNEKLLRDANGLIALSKDDIRQTLAQYRRQLVS